MTGAGTCKQAICIQEIALLQCAFPTSCHCEGAKRRFHLRRRGRRLKKKEEKKEEVVALFLADSKPHLYADATATIQKYMHEKQEAAASVIKEMTADLFYFAAGFYAPVLRC